MGYGESGGKRDGVVENEGIERNCDGGIEWASEWARTARGIPLPFASKDGIAIYIAKCAYLHIHQVDNSCWSCPGETYVDQR